MIASLRNKILQAYFVDKNKTFVLFWKLFCWKLCSLWDNVEKYGTDGRGINESLLLHMRFAC